MRSRRFFRTKRKANKNKGNATTDSTTDESGLDESFLEDSARYIDTSWQIHRQWITNRKSTKSIQSNGDISETASLLKEKIDDKITENGHVTPPLENNNNNNNITDENGVDEVDTNVKVTVVNAVVHNEASEEAEKTTDRNPPDNKSAESESTSSATTENDDTGCDGDNELHIHETSSIKNGAKHKQNTAVMTSQPRSSYRNNRSEGMDLSYVTERIIALWFPGDVAPSTYRLGQRQAAHMLHNKHSDNYMVFNLSEPRRATRNEHERVREVGWPADLAPPLERLCSICKDIDSWLSTDKQRIAVLHARGNRERLGVIVDAYMHYSSICGTADQALDRFAMRRFLDDTVGTMDFPSNKRYVEYFSGLLSGNIRINAAPLYLTHVTVLGAPAFDAPGGCRAFLKVYEGLVPVYTSGVYNVNNGMRQFTVNVASERQRRGLQLRGDILVKCYHRRSNHRETIFSCQFHTCAVSDYTLSFTRQELDVACNDLRFPLDGAVELHFSPTPETRLPSPAPTPAVSVEFADDRIVRYDSYENLGAETTEDESEADVTDADVSHTYGPLDGSIYATIAKKPDLSPVGTGVNVGGGIISSPLTVSMDSGISSAGHQQASHGAPLSNNTSNESSSPPPASSSGGALLTPEDRHRELDELLSDMLLTVENIPDVVKPRSSSRCSGGGAAVLGNNSNNSTSTSNALVVGSASSRSSPFTTQHRDRRTNGRTCEQTLQSVIHTLDSVSYIDEDCALQNGANLAEIPYHARQDSRPFTYGALPAEGSMIAQQTGLASPSLVRKASFGKSNQYDYRNGSIPNGDSQNSTLRRTHSGPYNGTSKRDPIECIFTSRANDSFRREEFRNDTLKRSNTEGTLRRPNTNGYLKQTSTTVTSPYSDSESLSPPSGFGRAINGRGNSTTLRSPDFIDSSYNSTSNGNNNLTWLQRQQQKLKERREILLREERQPHETRLISELRSMQHTSHRHMRPTASHRLDGYTSDTTAFADDDDDFTIPLHINTSTSSRKSGPTSPLLPHRTSSRKFTNNLTSPQSNTSSRTGTTERPFSSIKRGHEQNKKYVDQYREDSYSSWRTTSASEVDGSPPPTSTSPRPQTPAFPVHPRTPYSNNSVHFDLTQGGLPPKSPTTQRKDLSVSPLTNGNSTEYSTINHQTNGILRSSLSTPTPQTDPYQQHSPKSPSFNGSSSPGYYGHSRRSSVHSNSEPPQEVSAANVKFVRDTSKYWYKPTISREEAINLLRNQPPGTFVVRDSNSFPGAFGMALKVATPPPNVQPKSNNGDELIRHFLIEPTSRGVRLKGCTNEPVFSSLSALVYQHSVMPLALPCRLLLPEGNSGRVSDNNSLSNAQQLLTQGAACNVLYLYTVDMESLTGPQAIRKAVLQLFLQRPLPKAIVVHFKVSGQGITLTDNKRKLFFRRHYPANTISHCGMDPDDHRWSHSSDETGMPISSNRCFGFVARKPASNTDNQCHVFAELEPGQPATAIVNFVSKVMMTHSQGKANIV